MLLSPRLYQYYHGSAAGMEVKNWKKLFEEL